MRKRGHIITVLILILLAGWAVPVQAALLCASPGAAGTGYPGGIINDYWAGSGDPAIGNTSITLGGRRAGGAGNNIVAGDMVLIIQIQDADITSTNTSAYGGSTATVRSSGQYQYVRADSGVGAGGGLLNFTPALLNNYHTRNYVAGSNGQSRWQAILVPQYSSAFASNVTAPAWNGTTGGVVALDVENTLTLSGGTAINVAGLGFRGGAGRRLAGGAGADTDYRTLATVNTNGSKGEGIAGVPRYLNDTSSYNAAPNVTNTGVEGYPNGSYARGAPGNGGGGGTDGNPPANDENSGGGGGSNYGVGGKGGNSWNSVTDSGGLGGYGFSSILTSNKVFLGGGGAAGTTNNGTADPATYSAPPGLACNDGALAGICSSGAAGGGIVMVRAGYITGFGLIDARGADAYNVLNDGAGGGGGGGTVLLQAYTDGYATVNVSGGNGGNAWRGRTDPIDRHGPGGGGGGGFIAYSPSTSTVVANYSAGLSGKSAGEDSFGSTSGNGGITTFDLVPAPGIIPGTLCQPAIKAASLVVDNGTPGVIDSGDTIEYTVVYRNISDANITGFNITDTLPATMSYVTGSLSVTGSGGASPSANGAYNGTSATNLLSANITLPSGGAVTAKLRGTTSAPGCSVVSNQANSVQGGGEVLGLSDNADSNQNFGGLPSGTYINQTPYGTSGATDATGFTMACPDLSTSTKDWVDLNGGDHEPGDKLRYTITVIDTGGGTATGVTVTDDLPANVNSFSLVSIPAGAASSWSPAPAGAYSNGVLNVTGITVPANGSVTIVFEVTINNLVPNPTTIDNTAIVTNPLGPGKNADAPPVIVTNSFTPITGNKYLYLYDNTSAPPYKLSRAKPSGLTGRVTLNDNGGARTWALDPALAGNVTTLGNNVTVNLWLANTTTSTRTRNVEVRLACSSDPATFATSGNLSLSLPRDNSPSNFPINLTGNLPMTCTATNSWQLTVINQTTNTVRNVYVYPMSGTNNSYVDLPSQNVINVDSITYYNAAYPAGSAITSVTPGSTVYIRAVVSDPFGKDDINALDLPATRPDITITNPSGTTVLPATDMTELLGPPSPATAATKTFEYAYLVPAGGPAGNWTVRVDAVEGTEGTVSDYGNVPMPLVVPMPSLIVLKSAQTISDPVNGQTSPKAIPGAYIDYTITVTNFGAGTADDGTTVITDPIPANTELFVGDIDGAGPGLGPILFTDGSGAASSGLTYSFIDLASITDDLEFSGDGINYNKTPADSGDHFDPTVTNVKIWPKDIFKAAAGINHPTFSVKFRVRIK